MIYPPTQLVHWPGQDTPACEEHTAKLLSLASHMGFSLSTTPIDAGTVATFDTLKFLDEHGSFFCPNCVNEEKKRSAANATT